MAVTFISKLNKILGARLKNFQSGLMRGERSNRVMGYIVSTDFSRIDHHRRQEKMMKILEKELTPSELERVGPIVTMTPLEADIGESAA